VSSSSDRDIRISLSRDSRASLRALDGARDARVPECRPSTSTLRYAIPRERATRVARGGWGSAVDENERRRSTNARRQMLITRCASESFTSSVVVVVSLQKVLMVIDFLSSRSAHGGGLRDDIRLRDGRLRKLKLQVVDVAHGEERARRTAD